VLPDDWGLGCQHIWYKLSVGQARLRSLSRTRKESPGTKKSEMLIWEEAQGGGGGKERREAGWQRQ
jgi:hypothetical protein